jgi:hypothetical protein
MTMNRSTLTTASLAGAALMFIAGCSSSGGAKPSDTPTTHASSSDLVSTPAPDPSKAAIVDAVAMIPTYLATLDKLYNDASVPLNEIYNVAIQPESTVEAVAIGRFRAAGYRGVGRTKLASTYAATAYLSGLGGAGSTAKMPTVKVTACVDVSGSGARDAKGSAVGNLKKPKFLVEKLTIRKVNFSGTSGWRISDAPNTESNLCGT